MRNICVLALVSVVLCPCGTSADQKTESDGTFSEVVDFESEFPQRPWDVKRQTGYFVGRKPVPFLDDGFILDMLDAAVEQCGG